MFAPIALLDVLSSTTARRSGRKPHISWQLSDLATKPGEIYGLETHVVEAPRPQTSRHIERDLGQEHRNVGEDPAILMGYDGGIQLRSEAKLPVRFV